ncbi:hypothetical protein CRM22_002428 [Opisthorchis felineus]|uniref:Uncharacterized protein n=1 Tax=Opisthorchis felineus TaxID=147828 RepID=A0A4S2M616_OPIFE|nr:hypothetical protein CRM22_002428 [Opisthorchis felineus]
MFILHGATGYLMGNTGGVTYPYPTSIRSPEDRTAVTDRQKGAKTTAFHQQPTRQQDIKPPDATTKAHQSPLSPNSGAIDTSDQWIPTAVKHRRLALPALKKAANKTPDTVTVIYSRVTEPPALSLAARKAEEEAQ